MEKVYEKRELSVADILKNVKKHLGIKTNKELAVLLDVQPNTISTWKTRNSPDYEKLITIIREARGDLNKFFFDESHCHKIVKNEQRLVTVPLEHQYEYVTAFKNDIFLKKLPKHHFSIVTGEEKLRAFQVSDLNSWYAFKGAFYAISSLSKNIRVGNVYVIVNKVKGIFTGLIERDADDPDIIYVLGDSKWMVGNKIKMSLKDVVEVWKVKHIVLNDNA